jgi:putative intracellular protease/amidase
MTQTLGTILLVCTSHSDLGETGQKTGFWMEELAAPYYAFKEAGYAIALASPNGGTPPVDPGSLAKATRGPLTDRFEADSDAMAQLSSVQKLEHIADADGFAALFLVGGHGTMWDFADNPDLSRLLMAGVAQGKVIAAVCHGVAGLLADGVPAVLKGKAVSGFSNQEEAAVGLTEVVPFLLETKLSEAGYVYRGGAMFAPHVITDGRLVTGQNPSSSHGAAEAVIALLSQS